MGAWGIGIFENDAALDWLNELIKSTSSEFIEKSIEIVLSEEEYLDYDDCSSALAASEIIASLRGNPPIKLPDEVESWIAENSVKINEGLTKKAIEAINRIKENSEVKELIGEDTDDINLWINEIDGLISRLKAVVVARQL